MLAYAMISAGEDKMRQVKRFVYSVLLNIVISAITVVVVLQIWEHDHPLLTAESTPVVIIVTPTQAISLPILANNSGLGEITPIESGAEITGTLQASPTMEMLTYLVKKGDSLGALAVQFNVRLSDIMTVNNLTDPDSIFVGQIIYIPTAPLPDATSTSIPPTIVASPTPRPSATQGATLTATPTLTGQEPQVVIDSVIGVGVLENERVVLRRTGGGELSLAGWQLDDGSGNVYDFPQLTLYEDGAINLNSRTGQNTVVDLFWGLTSPIWRSGKTVYLYDAQKNLRATYSVP
jgi:LysM repeat protein